MTLLFKSPNSEFAVYHSEFRLKLRSKRVRKVLRPSRTTLSSCFCICALRSLTLRRMACWNELAGPISTSGEKVERTVEILLLMNLIRPEHTNQHILILCIAKCKGLISPERYGTMDRAVWVLWVLKPSWNETRTDCISLIWLRGSNLREWTGIEETIRVSKAYNKYVDTPTVL